MIDTSRAQNISKLIIGSLLDDCGYTIEEIVPGCIQAVLDLADQDDELLDEAANFLADGGVVDESDDTWLGDEGDHIIDDEPNFT